MIYKCVVKPNVGVVYIMFILIIIFTFHEFRKILCKSRPLSIALFIFSNSYDEFQGYVKRQTWKKKTSRRTGKTIKKDLRQHSLNPRKNHNDLDFKCIDDVEIFLSLRLSDYISFRENINGLRTSFWPHRIPHPRNIDLFTTSRAKI